MSCPVAGLDTPARCGTARVFEDRSTGRGRTIALRIIVVPANGPRTNSDPVVFLAGGPGQVATDLVSDIVDGLAEARVRRDIVFIDQRGTGHDSPLRCNLLAREDDLAHLASGALPEARLRACLATMEANPALYTTPIAMRDLYETQSTRVCRHQFDRRVLRLLRGTGVHASVPVEGTSYCA